MADEHRPRSWLEKARAFQSPLLSVAELVALHGARDEREAERLLRLYMMAAEDRIANRRTR